MSFDLTQAIESTVAVAAEHAIVVDKEGRFPQETLDAARAAGLLGLISSPDIGGLGLGPRAAAQAVEQVARECGSSAMVLCMHYSGTAVIEAFGPRSVRTEIAAGRHLTTLAFSERGSRSHFWAPIGTADAVGGEVALSAQKSWVTSASHADSYVWSSKPTSAEGMSSLWLMERTDKGVTVDGGFDGLGLRGNDSRPVRAEDVAVSADRRLGDDGGGFDIMMGTVLPTFQLLVASGALGLMEATVQNSAAHASGTRYEHLDSSLADLPTIRAYLARMRIKTDLARSLWLDTIDAMETRREDVMLRVLEIKAACGDLVVEVTDLGMRVCGGAAFRKDVGVERRFRDGRAALVMAPTSDQLYDFIGKAICGMDLF